MADGDGNGDDEQQAEAVPNKMLNGMPNHHTRGLTNDYRAANGYSTEATNRDGHREVD